ncbi:DNA polymerase III subunit theta [Rahnella victoriana]|uniref:DNA polymerase III subunit theta n=1 Tax=Rahnella victoriana TaxID=1510570 RepID=UPI001E324049|nr:DNA polymerase III subunit theta [Rahnella victoriana]UHM89373.1 DNA polymerase III subunit theta [Rahnella victoriana]
MNKTLAGLSKEEMDKVSAGLAAGTVAVRERNHLPVNADEVEMEQPEHLRAYFRERLAHYRQQPAKK